MQQTITLFLLLLIPALLFASGRRFFRTLRQPKKIIADNNGMIKISCNPSVFARFSKRKEAYFYDSENFYQVMNGTTTKIPLADIFQIKPGFTTVNNRRKWSVFCLKHGQKKEFQFYHNLTMFNHNFAGFLAAVKEANPEAEVKEVSAFNL